MLSQIIVELPWNSPDGCLACFSAGIILSGLYRNAEAADQVTERGAVVFLFLLMFMIFAGTFRDLHDLWPRDG